MIGGHHLITDCVPKLMPNQLRIVVANSSAEALARLAKKTFDAIILDLDLQDGAQEIDLVDTTLVNTPAVLIYSRNLSESDFRVSYRRGVRAFVGKHESANRLLDGLQAAIEGRQFLPPDLLAKTMVDANNEIPAMTPRLWQVLDSLCRNPLKDNNTMAAEFGLSIGRVKNILCEVYLLFGVSIRHELVREAARRGFRPGDPCVRRVMTPMCKARPNGPLMKRVFSCTLGLGRHDNAMM